MWNKCSSQSNTNTLRDTHSTYRLRSTTTSQVSHSNLTPANVRVCVCLCVLLLIDTIHLHAPRRQCKQRERVGLSARWRDIVPLSFARGARVHTRLSISLSRDENVQINADRRRRRQRPKSDAATARSRVMASSRSSAHTHTDHRAWR